MCIFAGCGPLRVHWSCSHEDQAAQADSTYRVHQGPLLLVPLSAERKEMQREQKSKYLLPLKRFIIYLFICLFIYLFIYLLIIYVFINYLTYLFVCLFFDCLFVCFICYYLGSYYHC